MNNIKYLIIGAGVTGLAFANYIKSNNYLILEKENKPGGYCKTIYKDGYIWDYSGHFYHFNNEILRQEFLNNLGYENIIIKDKNTKIFYNKLLIDYPFQSNIHQLSKDEFIECLYDIFHSTPKRYYKSFEDMLYSKYGKSITEKFLKPYNEKLYACSLKELDKNAMGRFFPNTNIVDIIENMKSKHDNSYNKEFYYPKLGSIMFINYLLEKLHDDKILYNNKVIKIDIDNKIAYTSDSAIKYEVLINTSPLNYFINMVYRKKSDILKYNKVIVYNLGFDKKSKYTNLHWLYVPSANFIFYRVGFYDNILNADKLSLYVEVSLKPEEAIDAESKIPQIINELKEMEIIEDHKLISYSIIEMDPAYVHVSNESGYFVNKIKNQLRKNDIYTIGRYGGWRYCSIEDCIIEAKNLASELLTI